MAALRPPVICVFAKPARPGEVKTRLIPRYGAKLAAQLAEAFFEDTWQSLAALPWARWIVATTDGDPRHWKTVPSSSIWMQGGGDLGARLERIMSRALAEAEIAIAIGADSPGLPIRYLAQARERLATFDAVLGPSDDGGFYLLALKRCPEGLLADLPWSCATTSAATRTRLEDQGMRVAVLEPWFDVDVPEDLERLRRLLRDGKISAPATAQLLTECAQSSLEYGEAK